jgi:hypothetical protein
MKMIFDQPEFGLFWNVLKDAALNPRIQCVSVLCALRSLTTVNFCSPSQLEEFHRLKIETKEPLHTMERVVFDNNLVVNLANPGSEEFQQFTKAIIEEYPKFDDTKKWALLKFLAGEELILDIEFVKGIIQFVSDEISRILDTDSGQAIVPHWSLDAYKLIGKYINAQTEKEPLYEIFKIFISLFASLDEDDVGDGEPYMFVNLDPFFFFF